MNRTDEPLRTEILRLREDNEDLRASARRWQWLYEQAAGAQTNIVSRARTPRLEGRSRHRVDGGNIPPGRETISS